MHNKLIYDKSYNSTHHIGNRNDSYVIDYDKIKILGLYRKSCHRHITKWQTTNVCSENSISDKRNRVDGDIKTILSAIFDSTAMFEYHAHF